MALNSSGPISLAGTTAGQSIELENGGNGTTQISLNDTAVRTLAGVPSGAITMPTNFWGKSNRVAVSYTFSSTTADATLNLSSLGGYSAGKTDFTITVNSGVYLYATSTGGYGLNLSGATTGDTVTLVNNGYIMGQGGKGGSWQTVAPTAGGPALNLGIGTNITITNTSGYIGGGGGGGGWGDPVSSGRAYNGGGGGAGGGSGGSGGGNAPGAGGSPGNTGGTGSGWFYGGGSSSGGGGGGRIMPGTGGSPGVNGVYAKGGGGGGAGGGGASSDFVWGKGSDTYKSGSGGGGGYGASGGYGVRTTTSGGGSGGAGAGGSAGNSGGNAYSTNVLGTNSGASGGKAINLNGKSVTWTGGSASSSRAYGAVS